jgi:hypothetical protein
MAPRPLLTDEERRLFFGIPDDPDGLVLQYTFTRSDQDLAAARRGAANQLGFAVQLALLRHSERDALTVVDETVGWARLLRAQCEVKVLADLADEDPLRGAADRYLTLRKFAPDLLEALEFKAARAYDPTLSAIRLLRDLNQSGKRDIPANAPMPFRKDFARQLRRGELEGVELRDGRLHIAPVKAATPPGAEALAAVIHAMLPRVRITELLHEVSLRTRSSAAFTNLCAGEACDNENALLAAILADATNLGLTRMATASQGVTRDQLIWIADAYIRPRPTRRRSRESSMRIMPCRSPRSGATGRPPHPTGNSFARPSAAMPAAISTLAMGTIPASAFTPTFPDQHGPYSIGDEPRGAVMSRCARWCQKMRSRLKITAAATSSMCTAPFQNHRAQSL